jgi:Fur family peroxide stress response transcriptional regulator
MPQRNEYFHQLLAAFENSCRESGLRLTHQRLEIFRELALATDHPAAELLHQRLRRKIPTLSLDTVYRTLATFVEHGIASKVETVESQARYEAVGTRHHHLICNRCSSIMDFHWTEIDTLPLPMSISDWGKVVTRNVVMYGVCISCTHKQLENE